MSVLFSIRILGSDSGEAPQQALQPGSYNNDINSNMDADVAILSDPDSLQLSSEAEDQFPEFDTQETSLDQRIRRHQLSLKGNDFHDDSNRSKIQSLQRSVIDEKGSWDDDPGSSDGESLIDRSSKAMSVECNFQGD